ncbi:5'/3'-nucleotidase SurE [Pseudoroseicyclus aestuarii]|uniref:5'-nucleotidase SurE n=1 Tax=Pseudoroseicyclus aestuarii TaxID=1795041 RepID=A0A318SVK0_9RHOB|nr:5'/3'-nucleotidase SurE [Pseudoroseicyclus aestuarii]PYE85633.1 5'-nucleotidase /3'-nucleotidase /exopolyphosphatase [Pseudoroseicyclus aestuarii]
MRVLITNDDGINAPGLEVLEAIATDIAGPGGEVWCVAPAFEQSGVGHCISYTRPTMISQFGPRRFAAEGSPADCVIAAIHEVMETAPDLVLSGVNRGNNSAENAVYSGTIGGAMEAALHGLPAIALSQYYGPGNRELEDPFEAARAHGTDVVRRLLDHGTWGGDGDYVPFYNVNFPACPADEVQGMRVGRQGFRRSRGFGIEPMNSPGGRRFFWIKGGRQDLPTGPGTDAQDNMDGYVSITPMRADLTAHDLLDGLTASLGRAD